MPKFTLIAEHTDLYGKPDGTKVNYEFHCEYLPEVLQHMDLFLRGTGFVADGVLDYINDDAEVSLTPMREQVMEEFDNFPSFGTAADRSPYYFDTERNK